MKSNKGFFITLLLSIILGTIFHWIMPGLGLGYLLTFFIIGFEIPYIVKYSSWYSKYKYLIIVLLLSIGLAVNWINYGFSKTLLNYVVFSCALLIFSIISFKTSSKK